GGRSSAPEISNFPRREREQERRVEEQEAGAQDHHQADPGVYPQIRHQRVRESPQALPNAVRYRRNPEVNQPPEWDPADHQHGEERADSSDDRQWTATPVELCP